MKQTRRPHRPGAVLQRLGTAAVLAVTLAYPTPTAAQPGAVAASGPSQEQGAEKPSDSGELGGTGTSPSSATGWADDPAARRGGFMLGTRVGLWLGDLSGYPNDLAKIGQDRFYSTTETAVGVGGDLWIGGAFTDWFSMGVGTTIGRQWGNDLVASTRAVGLYVEGYPLWILGGAGQDVGLGLTVGVAIADAVRDADDAVVVDSGLSSRLGFSVFYEGIRASNLSMGPALGVDFVWSPAATGTMGWLGWRAVLYEDP